MIRVPTALIGVVRQLSKLHREGHTIALLQGLEELLAQFDSDIDIDIAPSSFAVKKLSMRLEKLESHLASKSESLETKLEAIVKHLEKLERAISSSKYSNTRPLRQAYSYQQPQVELQPRTNSSLATRLAVSPQSLIIETEKLSAKEFISWSRNRDPMSVGWEWDARTELYHPVK